MAYVVVACIGGKKNLKNKMSEGLAIIAAMLELHIISFLTFSSKIMCYSLIKKCYKNNAWY